MEEAQIVLDVEASPISESMQSKLDKLWCKTNEANNFTIFCISHIISQSKKNLFEPFVISIGPFHHGKKHLRTLEEQKWRFLKDFLSRGDTSLDRCLSEMELLEKRTRGCYSETVNPDSNAFVEMMMLDGCFVLEYFLKLKQEDLNPIPEVAWNSHFINLDFLLLENQIPFFIVEKLYEIGLKQEDRFNFVNHMVSFFSRRLTNNSIDSQISDLPPAEIHHLVHLCYHYLVPNPETPVVSISKSFDLTGKFCTNRIIEGFPRSMMEHTGKSHHSSSGSSSRALPNSTRDMSSMVIPCATEVKQKGLKFRRKSNPRHMLHISFEYGVLEIPKLVITDGTKPFFANLIAFEHSKYGKEGSPFTSFVKFLDNLVNTPNDVTILQQCEIVENWLGSEEELTRFINQVTEGTIL
ncbi:UPF0481 protein At3g47200-like [Carex rostrata]